jgi:hypothetical protein
MIIYCRKIPLFISFLIAIMIQSCDTIIFERGNGDLAIRTIAVDEFKEIFLNGNYQVFLEQGEDPKVVIKTDDNLVDLITVESRRGTLAITNIKRIKGSDGIKIFITYGKLERLISGGASSVFTNTPIVGNQLELSMSGAGVMDLELEVTDLEVQLSGAGLIILEGEVEQQAVSLTGAGSLESFDLKSTNCEITISGVGGAEINVTGNLIAKISGLGGIEYRGSPKDIRREVSGIGKIKESN